MSDSSSDGDTESVFLSTRWRKRSACRDSDSSRDSNERPSQPKRRRVKRQHRYAKSGSRVSDSLLHTSEAEIQNSLSTGGRSYALEPENRVAADETDDISGKESTDKFISESGGNSGCEISQEIERSQEMYNSCRHPDVSSTTMEREVRSEEMNISNDEAGDTSTTEESEGMSEEVSTSTISDDESASPSASLETILPAADMSDSSSDGDSQNCPICLLTFGVQEVGTPDNCDHFFCIECLEEWSAIDNTCPVDRQQFNVILSRTYPGRVIRRLIHLRPQELQSEDEDLVLQGDVFCVACGESDREGRMISCHGCFLSYHLECLIPPLDTVPFEDWFCPMCAVISSSFEIF
jgi:PHD and RING finger domain-containing protein 1